MKKTTILRSFAFSTAGFLLVACGGSGTAPQDTVSPEIDSSVELDIALEDTQSTEAIIQKSDWCETALGGAEGTRPFAQDFARAHVGIRLFGPSANWVQQDTNLSVLLNTNTLENALIQPYAAQSGEICAELSMPANELPVVLSAQGGVAIVEPGQGTLELPEDTTRILLDLRDPSRISSLKETLTQLLSENIQLGSREVRHFHGFPSQSEGWTHFESSRKESGESIEGLASKEWPIAVLTGARLTPEAATLIGGLRLAKRITLLGYDIHSAVAESTWSGIESGGLIWRSSSLSTQGAPWPDRIPADAEPTSLEEALEIFENTEPPSSLSGTTDRSMLATYNREAKPEPSMLDQGKMRASLLVAYGTLDWFYPYFEAVGRGIDDALLTALDSIEELTDGDRLGFRESLGRFMHDLYDGHGFYWDNDREDWWDGYLAIQIHRINEQAVVRSSNHPGINPGDTILNIDGTDAGAWFEDKMKSFSASSDGYRFVLAADALKEVYGSRTLTLMDTEGVERTDIFLPEPYESMEKVAWGGSLRENGWLTELDAPGVYYVNMAASVTPDETPVVEQMTEIKEATGVVLDMRDYPNLHIYEFARNFHSALFTAPIFTFPTWTGSENFEWTEEIWDFTPAEQVYTGPIALLVSNKSVSAAECFAQMLMGLENVTIVGEQSASTNGTITDVMLPSNFQITFTGMLLLSPDGNPFHGIGVVPDEEVVPTADDFAAGLDPELNRAIEVLFSKAQ